MESLAEKSLAELAKLIYDRKIKPSEILEDCIKRIDEREGEVQAFEYLNADAAFETAQSLDDAEWLSWLHGIPIGIKDVMNTHDMPTTMGSPIYKNNRPNRDAAIVSFLRFLGAVVPGKTVSTEFAYFNPGKTRNPHNLKHTPGGSSMGSAASVADNMLPIAIGTQTAGSVIRPAAYCGVCGYKASQAAFSMDGILGLSQTMDSIGFFARDVFDFKFIRSALLANTDEEFNSLELIRNEIYSSYSVDEKPEFRVGVVYTPHWERVSSEQQKAFVEAAKRLDRNGIEVYEIEVDESGGDLTEAHGIVMAFEACRSLLGEWTNHRDLLSDPLKKLIEQGLACTYEEYLTAINCGDIGEGDLYNTFADVDLLMVPSAMGEAPATLDNTGDPLLNRMWTLLRAPSITIPYETGANGLPLALQFIGQRYFDDDLIDQVHQLQRYL